VSYYVHCGDWSFPDPTHETVIAAERAFRFGSNADRAPTHADGLVLASCVEALRYLLSGAPSNKAANDKLNQMRRAIRKPSGHGGKERGL
jgi:hypothetical protein